MTVGPAHDAPTIGWLVGRADQVPGDDGWLTAGERSAQQRYQVPKRRADWRLGRWTAKHAISAWLAGTGRIVLPERIGIVSRSATDGFPTVVGVEAPVPSVTLSHRDGIAMAAVAPPGTAVGCDIERVEPRSDRFVHDWFLDSECEQVYRRAGTALDELVTLTWGAKESVLKAIGEGLRRDTRSVEVELSPLAGVQLTNEWIGVAARDVAARDVAARDVVGGSYQCWARRSGPYLLVVTSCPAAGPPRPLTSPPVRTEASAGEGR